MGYISLDYLLKGSTYPNIFINDLGNLSYNLVGRVIHIATLVFVWPKPLCKKTTKKNDTLLLLSSSPKNGGG